MEDVVLEKTNCGKDTGEYKDRATTGHAGTEKEHLSLLMLAMYQLIVQDHVYHYCGLICGALANPRPFAQPSRATGCIILVPVSVYRIESCAGPSVEQEDTIILIVQCCSRASTLSLRKCASACRMGRDHICNTDE